MRQRLPGSYSATPSSDYPKYLAQPLCLGGAKQRTTCLSFAGQVCCETESVPAPDARPPDRDCSRRPAKATNRERPRQKGGINTGVAIHNQESSAELVRYELLRDGVLLDAASIPLAANGQTSGFIDRAFPRVDTSDFTGAVRCSAAGAGLFRAGAVELDAGNRIFTTLPVVPVEEATDQE